MSGFLYAVSGDPRPANAAKIHAWGLDYAFRNAQIDNRPTTAEFISGKASNVFADTRRQRDRELGYFKDKQSWRKLPQGASPDGSPRPELWIGYWNDAPPKPADLRRADAIFSRAQIPLGQGLFWQIPALTEIQETDGVVSAPCQLPAPEDFDDEGNLFVAAPVGEDLDLWNLIEPLALRLFGYAEPYPTHEELRAAAIALIARNYVVSMPELVILKALARDDRYMQVIMAATRAEWLFKVAAAASDDAEEQKKTSSTPSTSTSSNGGEASDPSTA